MSFECPNAKKLTGQTIQTTPPDNLTPHWGLPIHTDGTLCGPWCQDAAELRKPSRRCDGSQRIYQGIPGAFGKGNFIGFCDGCPNCEGKPRRNNFGGI